MDDREWTDLVAGLEDDAQRAPVAYRRRVRVG
jgi:hypothetical protein